MPLATICLLGVLGIILSAVKIITTILSAMNNKACGIMVVVLIIFWLYRKFN